MQNDKVFMIIFLPNGNVSFVCSLGDKVAGVSVLSIRGVAKVSNGSIAGLGIGPAGRNGTSDGCSSFGNPCGLFSRCHSGRGGVAITSGGSVGFDVSTPLVFVVGSVVRVV